MTKPIRTGPISFALVLALTLVLVACSNETTPVATPTAEASDTTRISLASTDLAVGDNRVVFALIRPGIGSVKDARVEVQTFFLSGADSQKAVQTAPASFHEWPGGTAGVYRANLTFDRAGDWGLGIIATLPDGSSLNVGARIEVKQTSSTPAIGSPAPRSKSKTASNAPQLTDITTDPKPDPDLYQVSIADAIDRAEPLLVTFATPAYCRTATCGPQMSIVKELKGRYADRMNFIHVEVYDNPTEIREQGIASARVVPALVEWGLPSEPWTFVIDSDGVIRAKYEGFVSAEELRESLDALR